MDYKKIEEYFNENNTSKEIEAKYNDYHIQWNFIGFDELINKTKFISSISLNLDFQMSTNLISTIDSKLDEVEKFWNSVRKGMQNYLDEVKNKEGKVARIYLDLLNNFYKNYKDYINEGLIPFIFADVFHNPVQHLTRQYDPTRFLDSRYDKLKLKTMKKMKEHLKQVLNEVDKDKQVFEILIDEYKRKIDLEEKEYHTNKKLAEL